MSDIQAKKRTSYSMLGKRNVKKIKYALSEYPLAITN